MFMMICLHERILKYIYKKKLKICICQRRWCCLLRIPISCVNALINFKSCQNILCFHCRNQSHRIVAASACSAKSDISGGNPVSNEWNCEKDGCSSAGNMFLNSVSHGVSFTKMSILGTRSLSSHAGAKSSDSENDVEEGFSDLELAPETDKVGDSSDDLEDGLSEDELSVEGKDEGADHALGLLDAAKDTNVEKALNKKIGTSPLFKILMEAPRLSINSALDKWVEEGNALGRSEISTVILNLRKWKLYGKALQVLIL